VPLTGNVTARAGIELLERSEDPSPIGARLADVTTSSHGQVVLVRSAILRTLDVRTQREAAARARTLGLLVAAPD